MPSLFTEDTYEQAIIELFENMGYEHLYAPDYDRDYTSPLLDSVLRDSLVRINRGLPLDAIEEAIAKLKNFDTGSLLQKNITFMDYLQNGITVKFFVKGEEQSSIVRLVDYEKEKNNTFYVVNQFTFLENGNNRRPDIILFINGLPLVLMELKSPAKDEVGAEKHTMNEDKARLMKDPRELNDFDGDMIRRVTEKKPRVSNGYDHINMLRSILSNEWDVSDIRDWENKIPIDCKDEFYEASVYIDEYWKELLNFYKRRRVVTAELYTKLQKMDKKLQEFRNCSDELFRARVLYVCLNGRSVKSRDGKWHGVPYEDVMATLDSLLNEMEE